MHNVNVICKVCHVKCRAGEAQARIKIAGRNINPGIEPGCPALQADSLPSKLPGECEECQDEVI